MPRHSALCLLLLTIPLFAQNSSINRRSAQAAVDLIQPADIKADISFLASDDLAGRNAGSREDHIATDYIASEFMRLGLKPMGDNGTYFQNMELVTASPDAERTTLTATISGTEHRYTLESGLPVGTTKLAPRSDAAARSSLQATESARLSSPTTILQESISKARSCSFCCASRRQTTRPRS